MIQPQLRTAIVVAVAGLAVITGFGRGSDDATAAAQPKACELLTQKDAKKILGKPVRRETDLTGTDASSCSYVVVKNAKRVVGLAVATFASEDEASKGYAKARANAQFDGLEVESVRKLGARAHWLPKTNNFDRTVLGERLVVGELTVLDGRHVYTAYVTPPSKDKARGVIKRAIDRRAR